MAAAWPVRHPSGQGAARSGHDRTVASQITMGHEAAGRRATLPTLRNSDQEGQQGPPGRERLRFWCPNCQR